jgi:hypothetical protein
MIYLSGSINLCNQAELQREAELYARNGWELKDPTTHRVSVTIDEADIDAFCQYLRSRPRDRKPKIWTDRDGQQHQVQTVTFFLNGTEMTGNWTRLRARIDPTARPAAAQAPATGQRQARTAPPVRRSPTPQAQANGFPQPQAQPQAPVAPAAPVWNSQPLEPDDDDIPF